MLVNKAAQPGVVPVVRSRSGFGSLNLAGCSTTVSWCEGASVSLKMKVGAVPVLTLAIMKLSYRGPCSAGLSYL